MTMLHHRPDSTTAVGTRSPISAQRPARASAPAQDLGWLRNIGIMNDYLRVPYANGSSYASQLLHRELSARGHRVTVVGPNDPGARPAELPPNRVELASIPLRNHPGVQLAMPSQAGLESLGGAKLQLLIAQTCQAMLFAGVWLRRTHGVPYVCVNTVHMPSVYNVMLPDALLKNTQASGFFAETLVPWVESHTVEVYNESDCLIVLSPGLERYWRKLGVTAPIRVIPRAIEPSVFENGDGEDPFDPAATRGGRLLVVCRHTREKELDRLLEIFAHHLAPARPELTLTLVGDGPDHPAFIEKAEALGIADRTFFAGERSLSEIPRWYRNADLFVYTSLSETYGQVISEALYSRLPVVAFDDGMGVSGQITEGVDGHLIDPIAADGNRTFAQRVMSLLDDAGKRESFADAARRLALRRCDRTRIVDRYYEAFEDARAHRVAAGNTVYKDTTALLARWTFMHGLTGAIGLMRKPAELNRRKAPTPNWELSQASFADALPAE
jgi:1,2-diacylglycerol 3-alpha-glucosyltransferase